MRKYTHADWVFFRELCCKRGLEFEPIGHTAVEGYTSYIPYKLA